MLKVLRLIDKLNHYLKILVGILLAIMSVIVIIQVFSRFMLSLPLSWSEELARYLMVYTVFLGVALALREQKLIGVEAVAERLSKRQRRRLKTTVNLVSIAFFLLLFIQGIKMLLKVHVQISASLGIPMSIPYAAIPIGSCLLIMNSIAVIIELFVGAGEGEA
ncbi:TRAP transporter small permease [Brevibacillus sp. NRS-1366]|uniref:TRAP transporter small permease n=1 Tax=Brevibacillus sp. NRS-1366 TaxID=3233899 RepID=UPI003D1BBCD7